MAERFVSFFPSIWLGEFNDYHAWLSARPSLLSFSVIADQMDDKIVASRHPYTIEAWCSSCSLNQPMLVSWHYGAINTDGSVHPAWTETAICTACGLNSRMRALISKIQSLGIPSWSKVYTPEAITDGFSRLRARFPRVTGSEFLGVNLVSGSSYPVAGHGSVMHQDLTALSFERATFDLVITQDVFEHVPDYKKAFAECYRVLNTSGVLLFTIPFFPHLEHTQILATVDANGHIDHLHPPEYHGNPVDSTGALCFQHFGWDILEDIRAAGFSTATAHLYWGPWQGHMGTPFFVFSASV